MINKICNTCELELCRSKFHKNPRTPELLSPKCISCTSEYDRARYLSKKTEILERVRAYASANEQKLLEYSKAYYVENTNKIKQKVSKYRQLESSRTRRYTLEKERKQTDPVYRVMQNRRGRRWVALKTTGNKKYHKTLESLGCTIGEWKAYLERRFDENMSWDNYGSYWHLDEIIPISAWDLSDPIEQKACFHHFNSQPLFWIDNISKGGINIREYEAEKQEFLMVLRALGEL